MSLGRLNLFRLVTALSLIPFSLGLTAGCTATQIAPPEELQGMGANYLIDACPGVPDGPLWVLPGVANSNQACQGPVIIIVQGVAGTGAGGQGCSIAATANPPFSLTWSGTGSGANAQVRAEASGLYGTSSDDRRQLATHFVGFRDALVQLQMTGPDCLLPGGAEFLVERLAQAMPLPSAEVPLYRYGYDPTANAVELRAGMRLQLVNSGFFDEETTQADITAAFSGTGVGTVSIAPGPLGTDPSQLPNLALNAFLSPFRLQIGISSGSWKPVKSVRYAANVLDLVSADNAEPYLALVYSPSTGKIPPIDQPTIQLSENPVLVWGETPSDLVSRIELLSGGATSEACGTQGVCTVLFGRAALIPEIAIEVNGQEVWVPVGTTLRQVIAVQRDWLGPDTTPTGQLQTLMQRIIPPFSQGQQAELVTVTFPRAQGNFNAGPLLRSSAFDVPLVRGDRISLSDQP